MPELAPSMPAKTPIALSDAQMSGLLAASYPLPPDSRAAFLEACARELARLPVVGDGALHRVIMAVQRAHFDPPDLSMGVKRSSKYRSAGLVPSPWPASQFVCQKFFLWWIVFLHKRSKVFAGSCIRLKMF
jgi:hypothetical protein